MLFVAERSVRDAVCVWIPGDAALQVDRRQPQSAPVFSPHLLGTLLSGISWHRGEVLAWNGREFGHVKYMQSREKGRESVCVRACMHLCVCVC